MAADQAVADLDDLLTPDALVDPYPSYQRMREDAPVRWNARWRGWVVTGHDDARLVLRDPTSYSSERVANHQRAAADGDEADDAFTRFPALALIGQWLSFLHPPDPHRPPRLLTAIGRATRTANVWHAV